MKHIVLCALIALCLSTRFTPRGGFTGGNVIIGDKNSVRKGSNNTINGESNSVRGNSNNVLDANNNKVIGDKNDLA